MVREGKVVRAIALRNQDGHELPYQAVVAHEGVHHRLGSLLRRAVCHEVYERLARHGV